MVDNVRVLKYKVRHVDAPIDLGICPTRQLKYPKMLKKEGPAQVLDLLIYQ